VEHTSGRRARLRVEDVTPDGPRSSTGEIVGVDHVQVAAPRGCEADARSFYSGVLGLEEIAKPPALAGRGGCWFRVGAQELHVGVTEGFSPASKAHPGLAVATGEALHGIAARLEQAGAPVAWADAAETPGRLRLHTADPWGNRIELLTDA
jgi:catechol 2,3-dioxygenase-like lactoylglutathione lyase family enzyme